MKMKIILLEKKMFDQAKLQKLIPLMFIFLLTSCGYVIKNNANAISYNCKGCFACKIYFTHKVRRQLDRETTLFHE